MKSIIQISVWVFAALFVATGCVPNEDVTFGVSRSEIVVAADGGVETLNVNASGRWIAEATVPWITISPAIGVGRANVDIKIDSTLVGKYTQPKRMTSVRFSSLDGYDFKDVRVEQYGYDRFIALNDTIEALPNYEVTNKRYFDIEVTSNVPFEVRVPGNVSWMRYDDYKFDLDRKDRPRKARVRFRWDSNTIPSDRSANIKFVPVDSYGNELGNLELDRQDSLAVSQVAAQTIENSRAGDSLAVLAIARALNYNIGTAAGESMDNWEFVSLWQVTDKGYVDSLSGRLRSVQFRSFNTWLNIKDFEKSDGLPYELIYLRTVEELVLYSNGNKLLKSISSGNIGKLTQLKKLQLYSVGLNKLEDDFGNLKNLEALDLSGNNFNELPAVIHPDSLPALKHLDFGNNKRYEIIDLKETAYPERQWGGLYGGGVFDWERILGWEKLEYLGLGVNYIHGTLPSDSELETAGFPKYALGDEYVSARGDTIANAVGLVRVLPKLKTFRMNLNYLKGALPDWLLYHPNLDEMIPESLIFTQNTYLKDINGNLSGFNNVPESDDYYYYGEADYASHGYSRKGYPLKDPALEGNRP